MMALITALYVVWRSFRIHGTRKLFLVFVEGITFLLADLTGLLLTSFLFLSFVVRFLQDPRASDEKSIPLLWSLKWYLYFLGTSALADSWRNPEKQ